MPLWESRRAGRGRRVRAGGNVSRGTAPAREPPAQERPVWRPPKLPPATVGRLSSVAGQNVPKAPGARSTWRAMPHLCPSVGRHGWAACCRPRRRQETGDVRPVPEALGHPGPLTTVRPAPVVEECPRPRWKKCNIPLMPCASALGGGGVSCVLSIDWFSIILYGHVQGPSKDGRACSRKHTTRRGCPDASGRGATMHRDDAPCLGRTVSGTHRRQGIRAVEPTKKGMRPRRNDLLAPRAGAGPGAQSR